ncbi:MAG TPA: cytosolic protein [Virgibacillus sp.]|nr:cytosolic protein [Virgibacillus sp.]
MSLVQKLKKYFSNHAETRDHHEDLDLQTRYYKTTKDHALMIIENFIKNSQIYEMNSLSKTHGEISVVKKKGKKLFIIVSVIMVKPYETAIDFSVTSESFFPFDFGYSTKMIQELYDQMNKELTLIQ